jgi:hypothetical protein
MEDRCITREEFAKDFIGAYKEGLDIAMGKKRGRPIRELLDELKEYVEEERAREQQGL